MAAPQDSWAYPLAKQLVDLFRCETLTFIRTTQGVYDTTTGTIAIGETATSGAGAVVSSMRKEWEGNGEEQELTAWLDHQLIEWPVLPSDRLEYLGKRWKITSADPTYSGDVVYASKVTARAE